MSLAHLITEVEPEGRGTKTAAKSTSSTRADPYTSGLSEGQKNKRRFDHILALGEDNFGCNLKSSSSEQSDDELVFIKQKKKKKKKKPGAKKASKQHEVRNARLHRNNFADVVTEELATLHRDGNTGINYTSGNAPPSIYPARKFCEVCGFQANYTCIRCGARFCCIKCQRIHKDTRCLKKVM